MLGRLALVVLFLAVSGAAQAQSRFDGWASAVIAGDWRSTRGAPIQAFDNAQRDLAAAFVAAGFKPADMVSLTLRPDRAEPITPQAAMAQVKAATARATKGCFFYLTSHGSPQGAVFGPNATLTPIALGTLLQEACGSRPTVVVVSACFSGVFVPALAAPNRLVITAARRDRSSFGCSEDATYPYFDGCILQSLPTAGDFVALANQARACVAEREKAENLEPPSEPQVSIGAQMQLLAPTLRFNRPTP